MIDQETRPASADTRPCTRCGQPIDTRRDSWRTGASSRDIQHTTCPTSPELAALPTVQAEDVAPVQCATEARLAPPAVPLPTYMTKAEAAALLRVHLNTISNKIKSGELPALRVKGGQNLLLDQRDVLALLEPVAVGEGVAA